MAQKEGPVGAIDRQTDTLFVSRSGETESLSAATACSAHNCRERSATMVHVKKILYEVSMFNCETIIQAVASSCGRASIIGISYETGHVSPARR